MGNYVLHTSNDYPNYTIATTKGKLIFISENKLFQEIDFERFEIRAASCS